MDTKTSMRILFCTGFFGLIATLLFMRGAWWVPAPAFAGLMVSSVFFFSKETEREKITWPATYLMRAD